MTRFGQQPPQRPVQRPQPAHVPARFSATHLVRHILQAFKNVRVQVTLGGEGGGHEGLGGGPGYPSVCVCVWGGGA